MVQAASQCLSIECDIMLRHPGEKNVFYILFERTIISTIVEHCDGLLGDFLRKISKSYEMTDVSYYYYLHNVLCQKSNFT